MQTARGLACVLLVVFHVVGPEPGSGLDLPKESGYRIFTLLFEHLRMPLFAFLSGFVYAYRPAAPGERVAFAKKKVVRLIVPLIVVSTLFFAVQSVAPGVNARPDWSEVWRIYVLPYVHFWFLQAMILIFLLVAATEPLMKTVRGFLAVMTVALIAHFLLPIPGNFFSSRYALYLLPFFLFGVGVNRFRDAISVRTLRPGALALLIVLWGIYAYICISDPLAAPRRSTAFATLLSFATCFVLIEYLRPAHVLAWIGSFSFTIYLYHVFFTAATRSALRAVADFPTLAHVALGLGAGIIGPIVIEITLRRSKVARRVLLGQS